MVKLTGPVVPGLFHLTALPRLALASFTTAPQVPTFAFSASTLASWRASAGSEPTKSTAKIIQANSNPVLLGIPLHLPLVGQRKGVPLCPSCSLNDCTISPGAQRSQLLFPTAHLRAHHRTTSESVSGRKSLRTAPPGRIAGVVFGVGNLRLTAPAHFDGVDLVVEVFVVGGAKAFVARVGDLVAVGRVGRVFVVFTVAGDFELTSSADVDRVDLTVDGVVRAIDARVGYLLAIGRVVRIVVFLIIVGDVELIRSVGVDRVDLAVVSVIAVVGYLLAIGRVGRTAIVRVVVGYFGLAPTAYVDGVNLRVVSVGGRKGYPLAVRRVGRFIAPRNFGPTTPVGVNRVDTVFSSVVCISYLAVFARKGGLRLTRHGR